MLSAIWAIMLIFGIVFGIANGRAELLTNAVISGGKSAVTLCIGLAGVVAVWSGIMKIAEEAGAIDILSDKLKGMMKRLFPSLPKDSAAGKYISTNLAANFLGLGWAATPAGINAMKELQKLSKDKSRASDAMCMFMIINMSSVQLITVSVLAYRAEYLSAAPGEIIAPAIIATAISTAAGIAAAKILGRVCRK
ncbi:MAG: nucleoside recognition protein [Firmicutes bacterium]|nr:nucleoside recognition protein [Bacillota bacterium]